VQYSTKVKRTCIEKAWLTDSQTEMVSQEAQMLDLLDKKYKPVLNMFKKLKEAMSKEVEGRMEMLSYQIQRDYQL
jgi:hypothetical protein